MNSVGALVPAPDTMSHTSCRNGSCTMDTGSPAHVDTRLQRRIGRCSFLFPFARTCSMATCAPSRSTSHPRTTPAHRPGQALTSTRRGRSKATIRYFPSSGMPQLAQVIRVHSPRLPIARAVNRVQLHRLDQAIEFVFLDVHPQLAQAAFKDECDQARIGALMEHGDDLGVMRNEIHLSFSIFSRRR